MREKKIKIRKFIFVVIVAVVAVSIFAVYNSFEPIQTNMNLDRPKIYDYESFIETWNMYAIKIDDNNLVLPRDSVKSMINKLNSIFKPLNNLEKKILKYENIIKNRENSQIFIPIKEYVEFLKGLRTEIKLNFKESQSPKDIKESICRRMKMSYISYEMLLKIKWANNFKDFFSDNIKEFYKKGFTRNIRSFEQYKTIMNSISLVGAGGFEPPTT